MRTTQSFSITLPTEMAEMVRARVASGEYASESEVIREGLRSLAAQEAAMERWLREEVVAAHDELTAHPERTVSLDEAFEGFNDRIRSIAAVE
jgi:antitoxin ParD1/3/4